MRFYNEKDTGDETSIQKSSGYASNATSRIRTKGSEVERMINKQER